MGGFWFVLFFYFCYSVSVTVALLSSVSCLRFLTLLTFLHTHAKINPLSLTSTLVTSSQLVQNEALARPL